MLHDIRRARPGAALFALLLGLFSASAHADLDILYINRCVGGCTVQGGTDDAINRQSSLFSGSKLITASAYSDAVFDATVSCVRSVLAQYDVNVVTVDPGAVARREVMLAGHASDIGQSSILADAPWQHGTPINNVIAFAFAGDIGTNVDMLCWITAQQFGTLYGLDHEFYCPDLMSYSQSCGIKTFANYYAECGEYAARTCDIGVSPPAGAQNSAARLALLPGQADVVFRGLFEVQGPSP